MELDSRPALEWRLGEAVLAALQDAGPASSAAPGYDEPWRRAALREAADVDEAPLGYAPSPRSTLGATRA